jgi:preprotein translocase subunit SecD
MTDLETLLRAALDDVAEHVPVSPNALAGYRRRRAQRSRRPRLAVGLSVTAVAAVVALIVVGAVVLSGGGSKPTTLTNGRTVVLTPSTAVSGGKLAGSATILQQRLRALGVAGARVERDGSTLQATVPASAMPALRSVAATAGVLQFRQVLAATTGSTTKGLGPVKHPVTHAATLSAGLLRTFTTWSCTQDSAPSSGAVAADYVVACDAEQPSSTTYLLAPSAIDGSEVSSASSGLDTTGQWVVNLNFNGKGANAWQQLTAKTYSIDGGTPDVGTSSCGPPNGCNAIAITLDGAVVSAPYSQTKGGIPGGVTQIGGNFTQRQADRLASVLKYGALPTTFEVGVAQ